MLSEFIQYLSEQIGQAYVWGGQHLKLTQENYVSVITKKETTKDGKPRGTYPDGQTYADAAIEFCKKKFDDGATVLYAYDCSGLGMYWIQNLHHIWSDKTADGMMRQCSDLTKAEPPKRGWWVFKQNERGKATHIGYMIDDTYLIEAKGRKFGVVKTKWRSRDWSIWGIPSIFYDEIVNPPQPEPPEPEPPTPPEPTPPATEKYVEVLGKSVRIRKGDSVLSRTITIAHRGDMLPFVAVAPSGWYQVSVVGYDEAYITSKPKYTRLVEL